MKLKSTRVTTKQDDLEELREAQKMMAHWRETFRRRPDDYFARRMFETWRGEVNALRKKYGMAA